MKRTPYKEFKKILKTLVEEIQNGDRTMVFIKIALVLLILLYLSGLVAQLLNGGQSAMLGNYTYIEPFTLNPFRSIFVALTNGLAGIIIVFTLSGVMYYNYLLHSVFEKEEPLDERGFSISEDGTQGTARWMNEFDIRRVFEWDKPAKVSGTIIGTKDKKALALKEAEDRNKNNMIIGAAGTGKSSCFVIPYALQCIKRSESLVLTDPKGELVSMLTPVLEKNGYEIKYFNLKNPEYSDGWDCLGELRGDINFATTFANTVITNTSDSSEAGFWRDGALNLLKGLLLQADAQREGMDEGTRRKRIDEAQSIAEFPEGTIPKLYANLVKKDNEISDIIEQTDVNQPWYSSIALFSQGTEVMQQSNITGLGVRLGILQSPSVARMLSNPDIDLLLPAKKKCAYFLIIDDTDNSLKFISALFFACFFNRVINFADAQPDKKCPVPINLILDEFYSIGEIPNFPEKLSTSRSRDVNISIICQSMAQLMRMYPEKEWNIVETNCSTKILLGGGDIETNTYFSDLCCYSTANTESQKLQQKTLDPFPVHPTYSENLGETQRKLLYPGEVNELKGKKMNLIHIIGEQPIKVKKFHFSQHPMGEEIDKNNQMTVEEFIKRKREKNQPNRKEDYFYNVMADLSKMIENDELKLMEGDDLDETETIASDEQNDQAFFKQHQTEDSEDEDVSEQEEPENELPEDNEEEGNWEDYDEFSDDDMTVSEIEIEIDEAEPHEAVPNIMFGIGKKEKEIKIDYDL